MNLAHVSVAIAVVTPLLSSRHMQISLPMLAVKIRFRVCLFDSDAIRDAVELDQDINQTPLNRLYHFDVISKYLWTSLRYQFPPEHFNGD